MPYRTLRGHRCCTSAQRTERQHKDQRCCWLRCPSQHVLFLAASRQKWPCQRGPCKCELDTSAAATQPTTETVWLPSRTLLLLLHMALLLPRPTAMQRPRLCMRPALHGHTRFEWQLPRLPSKKRLPLLLCMPLLVSRCSCAMTSPALLPRRLTCRRASHLECKKLCLLRLPLLQDCVHTGPSFWVLLECLEHLLSCRALQEGQAKSNAGCVTDSS